jgi:nicotinamidase-related amidase
VTTVAYDELDPDRTALVVFDLLNKYVRPNPERELELAPVISRCVGLRDALRAAGMPIFCIQPDHRPDGRDVARLYSDTDAQLRPWSDPENEFFGRDTRPIAGTWESRIIDELAPVDDDYLVLKHRWNAFFQTHLELSLRSRGIDTIVLCGGSVQIGIASTAYAARDLDFNLVVVRDCCTSHDDTATEFFMTRVFPFLSRVRDAAEVVAMVERSRVTT